MLSYSEYMELFDLKSDQRKGKIECFRTYDTIANEIIVLMTDIATGRFLLTRISYRQVYEDRDAIEKETLNLYRMLKEGASL